MHFELRELLFISVVSTALAQYSPKCNLRYTPVCGSDGITYSNMCRLNATISKGKGVTLAYRGPCGQPPRLSLLTDNCRCQLNFEPVCGTDGRTYNNKCLLECTRLKYDSSLSINHIGTCESLNGQCSILCPIENKPVCGNNGETYNNLCLLQCAAKLNPSVTLLNMGPCKRKCYCLPEDNPVCGTNGLTYSSHCALLCSKSGGIDVSVAYRGPCSNLHVIRYSGYIDRDEKVY